jgi:hypothetical protein
MEPAFGGVKSNQTFYSQLFAEPKLPFFICLSDHRLRFIFGIMISAPARRVYDRFLRQLRAGGRTNMYGAVPYLMKAFGLDRNTAFGIVCEWLDRQAQLGGDELAAVKHARNKGGR